MFDSSETAWLIYNKYFITKYIYIIKHEYKAF